MSLQAMDRVKIIGNEGRELAKGTIYNVNDYREPSHKYAVHIDGYTEDVLFFGDNALVKIEEEN